MHEFWPKLKASWTLHATHLRAHILHQRARCALAAAARGFETNQLLRLVESDCRIIAREKVTWAEPITQSIRAAAAACGGDRVAATALLRACLPRFEAVNMQLHAAAARHHLGHVLNAGNELGTQAEAWMRAQGIADPSRFAESVLPGFSDRRR